MLVSYGEIVDMASVLPGWDSLEAVSKWHRGFEIAGFVALGLLLLCEVLAYIYGTRRDSLSAVAEISAAQARQQQEQDANKKRDEEIAEAQRQASQARDGQQAAQKRIDDLTATRTLSKEQKSALVAALSQHTGIELFVLNAKGNKECQDYADQFTAMFQEAGWKVNPPPFRMVTREGQGVRILVADLQKAPPGAIILQDALKKIGIDAHGGIDPTLKPDAFEIYIGFK